MQNRKMLSKIFLGILSAGILLLCIGNVAYSIPSKAEKPNLIFVLVDDLGKEWISCYGAEDIQTPQIDKIAEKGVKFNKVYSMPQCTPSRVALMTGQYPYENGWVDHFDVPRWGHQVRFDPEMNPVFAKELRKAGYKTCVAGKWQISDFRIEPEAMVSAGFDEYCMWTGGEGGTNEKKSNKRYWDPYIHTKAGSKTYEGKFGPDIFSDFIIDFMKENKDDPMCIYYPMVLTHTPFVHTPHEPNAKTPIEKHRAMVRYTDFIMGKLVAAIDDLGLGENTYLIFTTDNGTAGSVIGKKAGHYIRGGKASLTQSGIDAPFIAKVPNTAKPGRESDALIDFTDIFPTFLELAGIKYGGEYPINGKSFASVLKGNKEKSLRDWTLSMGSHPASLDENGWVRSYRDFRDRAFRDEQFKIYVDTNRKVYRIFDLENDPYEQVNLIDETEKVKHIVKKYNKILSVIPTEDNDPKYAKSGKSYYDIPSEKLNKMSKSGHAKPNMKPLETEESYLEQRK